MNNWGKDCLTFHTTPLLISNPIVFPLYTLPWICPVWDQPVGLFANALNSKLSVFVRESFCDRGFSNRISFALVSKLATRSGTCTRVEVWSKSQDWKEWKSSFVLCVDIVAAADNSKFHDGGYL